MSITSDFHLHTAFSEDSDTPMEEMILSAIAKGLTSICITEHMDHLFPEQYGSFQVDTEACFQEYLRLKAKYGRQIEVLFGLELGMQPGTETYYRELSKQYPFDFLIASQHLTERQDPYYAEFWNGRSAEDGLRSYYQEMLANLRQMPDEAFDTLGHLDYIVRYANKHIPDFITPDCSDLTDEILRTLIAGNKCLEVNTAGLKYGLEHPNPHEDILRRYLELGGTRITIGSDAHRPEHIAYDFDAAASILKELGFTEYTIFRQRRPYTVSL